MEAKDKLTIKDAVNYLEKQGIGTGTNITVNLTASLMVGFTNDHLSQMPGDEVKLFLEWLELREYKITDNNKHTRTYEGLLHDFNNFKQSHPKFGIKPSQSSEQSQTSRH